MAFARVFLLLTLLAIPQDQVLQVRVVTKDGQTLVGVPSVTSVKIESSLGAVEVALANLTSLRIDQDQAVAYGADQTALKGKLLLESLNVKGLLGDLGFKREAMALVEVFKAPTTPTPDPAAKDKEVSFQLRTIDGNELTGPVDACALTCESSIGVLEIHLSKLMSLRRDKEKCTLQLQDGSTIRGSIRPRELTARTGLGVFTVKMENIASLTEAPRPREAPVRRAPPAVGGSRPPAPAEAKKPDIAHAAKTVVKAVLGPLRISKDGSRVYAINQSDGKLCRWNLPGLEEDGALALSGTEKAFDFNATGTRAIAVGNKTVTTVSLEPFALQKSFGVELDLEDVCVLDEDTLLASGNQGGALISLSKTAVLQKLRQGTNRLTVTPNKDRAFAGMWGYSIVRSPGAPIRLEAVGIHGPMTQLGGPFVISPDGRYGCPYFEGRLIRLGKCWAAARAAVATVDRHAASAFSPDSRFLYLFTFDGFLKIYEVQEFKLVSSHFLGVYATQAIMSPDGKTVVLAALSESKLGPMYQANSLLDLYRFEIPK